MDRLTVQGRMAQSFVAATIGMVIALALQIAGFATPGWLVYNFEYAWAGEETHGLKFEIGLWWAKACLLGKCDSAEYGSRNAIYLTGMLEYQVETSIALCLLVIAIFMYSCLRCGSGSGNLKTIVYCTVFCTLISGILAVAAAGKFGNEVRKFHDAFTLLGESPIEVPYSILLTGIGGILAMVMSAVILFAVKPWKSDARPPTDYEMTAHPNVGVYPGQPHPGYQYSGHRSAPYAGQRQHGYNYQGQHADPYAGQRQHGYNYRGQPADPYAGQKY